MAGVGFVLRKLTQEDNLLGTARAYAYSAMISSGPWLFTVLILGSIMLLGNYFASRGDLFEFRLIIIYNFAFSLVLSGPIYMIATRYLADRIYEKNIQGVPGLMLGALVLLYAIQIPLASIFYLCVVHMKPAEAFSAIVNFILIGTIWLVAIFISALKDYKTVTFSYAIGMVIAIVCAALLTLKFGTDGMLNGFNLGLLFIIATLIAKTFCEYPSYFMNPFDFLSYFKQYWELALSGFVYNAAAWVDKWMMWFSPHAERTSNGFFIYPNYDSAMFLAYLTIVPSMAMFVLSVETSFFERYIKFYKDIQQHANFAKIMDNHKNIVLGLLHSAKNILVLQVSLSIFAILLSPKLFSFLGINYMQLSIFRYGVLGALFHVFVLYLMIILSYFDNRKATLKVYLFFFLTNMVFTYITMQMGYTYYGYGYFISAVMTFVVAAFTVGYYINRLPYHTFITRNSSVLLQ